MQRMRELIAEVQASHPSDRFFDRIEQTWAASRQARAQYAAYNRAFQTMDDQSWSELKSKAVKHFLDHRPGQLKQGFFNQLNEAFAYQYLSRRGYAGVKVLREDGKVKPDLEYITGAELAFCEVKTIGISQEQLARWDAGGAFSGSIYSELSTGFLKKLDATITTAWNQIRAQGARGFIYLVVFFDDFTLMNYERYRTQIRRLIDAHQAPSIHVKVGLLGHRKLSKSPPQAAASEA
jgi:hypothetical protein